MAYTAQNPNYQSGTLHGMRIHFFKDRGAISPETAITLDEYERAELMLPYYNNQILNTPFSLVKKTDDNKFYLYIEAWKNQTHLSYVIIILMVMLIICSFIPMFGVILFRR